MLDMPGQNVPGQRVPAKIHYDVSERFSFLTSIAASRAIYALTRMRCEINTLLMVGEPLRQRWD